MTRAAIVLSLGLASLPAAAQTIRVEGDAQRSVATDTVDVVLLLSTELGSFSSSQGAIDRLIERIRAAASPSCSGAEPRLLLETSASQPLSWSVDPTLLSHRIRLRCPASPDQSLGAAATLLDSVLALDPGVTVERLSATVSKERAEEARRALLREAVEVALGRAQAAAEAGGSRVARLVSVEAVPEAGWRALRGRALPLRPGSLRVPGVPAPMEASPGSSGGAAFSTSVHYSAHVVVEFELADE